MAKLNDKSMLFGFGLATFVVFASFYFEFFRNYQPCLLCQMQRGVFMLIAIVALIGLIHRNNLANTRRYVVLMLALSVVGLFFAGRQIWLQAQPVHDPTMCMPGIHFLWKTGNYSDAFKMLFTGTKDCGEAKWHLFGLSMAGWSAVFFAVLGMVNTWYLFFKKGVTVR